MKKIITTTTLLLAAATIGAQAQENRAASTATVTADTSTARSEWLPEFTEVKVAARIAIRFVRVTEAEAPRIAYDTKGVTDSKFRAAVDKNGVLDISEKVSLDKRSATEVTVYYHSLSKIAIADADAEFAEPMVERMASMRVSDGATVTVELDTQDFEAVVTGKSRLNLSGSTRYLELEASTGIVAADSLTVMSAEVTASHGADVALKVTDRLKAETSTSGKVVWGGGPGIGKGR
ncbi:MAG: DUF2807 domain-containing protein, partial [Alistipes sp.]|nr:DUF2807 domain-containing protein [Alistipes sp.]